MKLFAKKEGSAPRLRNKAAFKHGGYALAITAVIVAVAVGVNVLFAVLAQRVNLDLDISLSGDNTLTQENIDFIKEVDRDVKVIVCSTEDDYTNGTLDYVAQNYYGASDATGAYYDQALTLMKLYSVYSDKISVEFADPYDPSFTAVTSEYGNSLAMGDIIVEATHQVDGKDTKRSTIIKYEDVYYLTDDSGYAAMGYGYYTVSGCRIETALTSAIYKVTSAETKQAVVIGTHCNPALVDTYAAALELNNFEVTEQSGNVVTDISSDVDMVIIAAPEEDFMAEELDIIDEWLYNGGQRGKGLIFLASVSSPNLPVLYSFLEEWGIGMDTGVLFETNKSNYLTGDPMSVIFATDTDMTSKNEEFPSIENILESTKAAAAGGNLPMYTTFENDGYRSTYPVLMTAGDTVVKAPVGTASDWTPDASYEKGAYPGLIVATEAEYVDNELCTSYLAAFSSYDFISENWLSTYNINNDLMMTTAKVISGAEDDGLVFKMKSQDAETFDSTVSASAATVITVIFQWAVPVLLIAAGVIVFVRRSRR